MEEDYPQCVTSSDLFKSRVIYLKHSDTLLVTCTTRSYGRNTPDSCGYLYLVKCKSQIKSLRESCEGREAWGMRDLRNEGPEEVSEDGVEVVSRGEKLRKRIGIESERK